MLTGAGKAPVRVGAARYGHSYPPSATHWSPGEAPSALGPPTTDGSRSSTTGLTGRRRAFRRQRDEHRIVPVVAPWRQAVQT